MGQSKKDGPVGLGSIIGKMRFPASVRDHVKNHQIWTRWNEIVGLELSKVTSPIEIRNRTLWIHVAHQAWAQQLHFLKPSILGKIRSQCPQAKLKDLQFRVGRINSLNQDSPEQKNLGVRQVPVRLSERQEMTLRAVEDPELRESIRRAMEAEAACLLSSTNQAHK